MIDQLKRFLKEPAKVTKAAVVCFFAAVLLTAYFLFTLPNDLVYHGGMIDSGRAAGVYAKLFVTIGLAFAFCFAAIYYLQLSKAEIIVYLDKKIEQASGHQSAAGEGAGAQSSFQANAFREAIKKAKATDEKWRVGLQHLCNQLNAGQGALYLVQLEGKKKSFQLKNGFALVLAEGEASPSFELGEGMVGQVGASGKSIYLEELPEGYAARIESGLGAALPKFLFLFSLKKENEVVGVIEVATFTDLSEADRKWAEEAGTILAAIS